MRILPYGILSKNLARKAVLAVLALAICTLLPAQSKLADKANEHYKNNQFAAAADLYRQALQEMENEGKQGRNTTLLKSKLAYCYRMNNKMDKAEALYAEVVKDEAAKSDNLYYYGEALMSNGKYAEAKKWFSDYQKLEPTDEKVGLMLRACDYAPLIEPYFPYVDIQAFPYNTDADDNAPIMSRKGLIFSSDRPQGIKLLKEKSGWTGRDYLNLYISEKKSDGSFADPIQYSSKLSEVNKHTGNASLTADGAEIFFTRNDNVLNKQNTYSLQLFSAKSGDTERWRDVEKLPFCSSNHIFMHPAISPDGKLLFFSSNRAGGFGGTDLWVSERKGGEWGKPENLGPAVNTTANEGFPFFALDGKLYFCSKGHPGFGGFDIFVTYKDENGAWTPAINLGKPINSPLDDISIFLATDQRSGFFTSSRSGGDDDIFMFTVLDQAPEPATVDQGAVVETTPRSPKEPQKEQPTATLEAKPAVNEELPPIEIVLQVEEVTVPSTPVVEEQKSGPAVEKKTAELPPIEIVLQVEEVMGPSTPVIEEQKPAPVVENTTKNPPAEIVLKVEEAAPPVTPAVEAPKPSPTIEKVVVEENNTEKPLREDQKLITPPANPTLETKPVEEPFAPRQVVEPIVSTGSPEQPYLTQLGTIADFSRKLQNGSIAVGEHFRLDGAVFDQGVWQLTPRITNPLDRLVAQMKAYPSLQVEISVHTEALGLDEENLRVSESRASTIVEYLQKEGITRKRILAKGCGETMPLNHCRNGENCSLEEHMFNHRIEVKVLALDGKW